MAVSLAQATQKDVVAHLLRLQYPENFFTDTFTALKPSIIPKPLNVDRPLYSLTIQFLGRITVGVANYINTSPEALQNLISRIRLTGTHRLFNTPVPIDLPGSWAFAYGRLWQQRGPSQIVNAVRAAELTTPIATPFTGVVGNFDCELYWNIYLVPFGVQDRHAAAFLYFGDDWGKTLQLELDYGDATSLGTPAGTTTTAFTAFGSGTGSPAVNIFETFAALGILRNSISPGLVVRNRQLNNTALTANGNNVKLFDLQRRKTNAIILKTGTLLTGSSAGISTYASLSDTLIDVTQINVDNKPIRNNQNNRMFKEFAGFRTNSVNPQGYMNMNFIDGRNAYSYFRADDPSIVAPGASFEVDANIITGGANEVVEMVQEQVLGEPEVVA